MGFEMPITISKVIEGIQANEYVLPAIQREFVWSTEQIEKLFDSLLRGYPISSFLFWQVQPAKLQDFQFYRFMDRYHQRDYRRNEPIALVGGMPVRAVLDGQQRLTALNIGLKGWYADKLPYYRWNTNGAFPMRKLYLNLRGPADDIEFAYEFRFLREEDASVKDAKHFWFLVGDVLQFSDMPKVFNYCVQSGLVQDGNTFASDTLVKLWQVVKEHKLINYFVEEEQDLDKVLNIFIRVNSGGTQLSYSDMLLSIATAQWQIRDARKEIYGLVDELNGVGEGFMFGKDFVLKASLVLTDVATIEFRVNSFNRANMLLIEQLWDEISRALRLTVRLIASWGYSWQTLPSAYAIIPLAYYLHKKGCPVSFVEASQHRADREAMLMYLRRALLKQAFGGQPDSVLRPIRRAMQGHADAFPAAAIYSALRGTPRSLDFNHADLEGLLAYRYGQGYTFTILSMLYPWLKYDQYFHMDHIFPRAMFTGAELAKWGIPQDRWPQWLEHVNDLANLQLLQGIPNQEKSDQDFEAWVATVHPEPHDWTTYRENHLIPNVSLAFEEFPAFLKARENLIEEKLSSLLGVS